jgi:hypothetical protein
VKAELRDHVDPEDTAGRVGSSLPLVDRKGRT